MKEKNYRIFFAYKKGSQGEAFSKEMHRKVTEHPEKYGDAYFSEETEKDGNFLMLEFIKDVEYFVIPYTAGFFDYDEKNNSNL